VSVRTEPSIDGITGTITGLGIDWIYTSPGFGISRWNCSHGRRELSEEKEQLWHVIGFIHTGAYDLHFRGQEVLIDSTSVVFYNPAEPFQSEHPFGCHDRGSALILRRETLLDVMTCFDPSAEERPDALFTSIHRKGFSEAYLLQRLLLERATGETPDPLAIEAATLRLLGELAEGCSRQEEGRPALRRDSDRARRRYAEDAKSLLQRRFRDPLRLDDIARELYVSTFHLCRLFKEETGLPLHRYLNRLRLREAMVPVMEGQGDLGELALDLGFSSHSHFTAAFKKEFGRSPAEVRRLAKTSRL
jgi:AraC family transcriptional regulator